MFAYNIHNRDNDPLNNTFESVWSGWSWDNAGTGALLPSLLTQWLGLVQDIEENNTFTGYDRNLYTLKNGVRLGQNSSDVTTEMVKVGLQNTVL